MAIFFMRKPDLCCSLASHDASPEAHHITGKGEVLCVLYWTDSVCEVLSIWIPELCLHFLCYQTFPLCSSCVPLDSFVLTFVTNTEHFLAWLFSVSLYFQYFWGKGVKLISILMVFSQFVAGEYLLYKQSSWSKLARWNIIYSNKWVLILNTSCIKKKQTLNLQHLMAPPWKTNWKNPPRSVLLFARTGFLICLQHFYFSNSAYSCMPSCSGNLSVSGMLILLFQYLFLAVLTSHFLEPGKQLELSN